MRIKCASDWDLMMRRHYIYIHTESSVTQESNENVSIYIPLENLMRFFGETFRINWSNLFSHDIALDMLQVVVVVSISLRNFSISLNWPNSLIRYSEWTVVQNPINNENRFASTTMSLSIRIELIKGLQKTKKSIQSIDRLKSPR
jgi:hypothetical protein